MLDYNQPIDRARPEAPQHRPQAGFNVLELVNLLWRRKIAIAVAALLGATLAVTVGKSLTPRYTATAQLYVDPRELQLVDRELTPRAQDVSGMSMVVESQARLITSNSVLLQVIQQADLDKDPEFGGGADGKGVMSSLLGLIGLQPHAPSAAEKKEVQLAALEALNRHITIRKTEKSFIVDIEVWSTDPAKAAMLANTLTSAYLAESRNSQASAARRATNDLSGRLKELRERLRNAETVLATYKAQNNFVGTQDALISDQQLSASNQRLSAARAATMDAQARLDQIEASRRTTADAGANSEALQSPTIANLRAQYADARKKYAEQAGELGPRHPALRQTEKQVEDLKRTINEEIDRFAQSAKNDLTRARDFEASLSRALEAQKRQSVQLSQAAVRLRELEREADASRDVYQSFLKRSRETEEQETLNTSAGPNHRRSDGAAAALVPAGDEPVRHDRLHLRRNRCIELVRRGRAAGGRCVRTGAGPSQSHSVAASSASSRAFAGAGDCPVPAGLASPGSRGGTAGTRRPAAATFDGREAPDRKAADRAPPGGRRHPHARCHSRHRRRHRPHPARLANAAPLLSTDDAAQRLARHARYGGPARRRKDNAGHRARRCR
ncbi:uncharacterized protein involved in exopolysaccharide biosynthesis [Bradyrhizobium sp. GM0.4]